MKAAIAIGSNLGDREQNVKDALDRLNSFNPRTKVLSSSSVFETAPEGGPAGQGKFLNAVAILQTTLNPHELLYFLWRVERIGGRWRKLDDPRNCPRTIDLDILIYGKRVIDDPILQIPHPRMTERLFVLRPFAEIAPDWFHPVPGKTIAELLTCIIRP